MEKTVLVVGLGLIGSSLALCIKRAHPTYQIFGWDRQETTLSIAQKTGIIDQAALDFNQSAEVADYIILAGPIQTTKDYLQKLSQLQLKSTLLVTDVGSTKEEVVKLGQAVPFDFIGGHPMAGSHKSGVLAANPLLFENAYFIFTPTMDLQPRTSELMALYVGTNAKFIQLSPKEHDQITGMLSHFPHIIASGLVNQADHFSIAYPRAKQLAAGGFRDITRIASSDPVMWTDILLSNRESLLELIKNWQQTMEEVKGWLQVQDKAAIYQFFEAAKDTRDAMPIHQTGAIPRFFDLYVDVPDYSGVIAEVTSLVAEANISLVNVKILETREDIIGILEISFKNEQDLVTAKAYIEQKTRYQCRIK